MNNTFKIVGALTIFFFTSALTMSPTLESTKASDEWEFLLDDELTNWDKFLGVPHYSVELEGYEKGDGKEGTPVGLNKDPLNVFSVKNINGESILSITGEMYGGLSTKKEYENYHLSFEFKWGTKKYEPRLNDKRDSGILYHCQEPHGQFWNVWMRAPEMQVQETDCGDFYPLVGVGMDIKASKKMDGDRSFWVYDPQGDLRTFKTEPWSDCKKIANYENPGDEWNTLELICIGDKAYHIVNGKVVMALENSVVFDEDGRPSTLTKGKIQIQSEGAEVFYKNIKIREVETLPKAFAKQLK
ncbi:MAG: DUF1080 domain-containing protein [Reichenbachiella sp.]